MLIVCKNHRTPNSYSSLVTLRLSLYSSDCLLLASSNCQCELRLCVRVCVCISMNISNCCCCQNFFVLWRFRRVWGTPGGSALCCILCVACFTLLSARSSVVLWPIPPSRGLLLYQPRRRDFLFVNVTESAIVLIRYQRGRGTSNPMSPLGFVSGETSDKISNVFRAWLILCRLLDSLCAGIHVRSKLGPSCFKDFRECYRCGGNYKVIFLSFLISVKHLLILSARFQYRS